MSIKKTNVKTNAQSLLEGFQLQKDLEFKEYEKRKQMELEESQKTTKLNELFTNKSKERQVALEYKNFMDNVKKSLVTECIYKLYSKGLESSDIYVTESDITRRYGYVTKFVEEYGVDNLLTRFKTKTSLLSEMYNIVTETYNKVKDKVDSKNPNTFVVPEEDRNEFLEEIESDEIDKVGEVINARVKEVIAKTIENNVENRDKIKKVMEDLEDTLETNKNKDDSLKEGFMRVAKSKINHITNNQNRSIYEFMMETVSQKAITDESFKSYFITENKIDYDKVSNTVILMYTFLETLNTAKIIDVDKEYVKTICEQL